MNENSARAYAHRCAVACLAVVVLLSGVAQSADRPAGAAPVGAVDYTLELTEILPPATEGKWFQPRPVAIPTRDGSPLAVMTIQRALGSDFYTGLSTARSIDGGRTWTLAPEDPGHGWRPGGNDLQVGVCDITLGWHAPTGRVIGIGHTATYTKKGFAGIEHRRDTVWIAYDPATGRWTPWRILALPETPDNRYFINGVHGQWLTEPDGSLLVPIYYLSPKIADARWMFSFRGAVARLRFDGRELTFVDAGRELNLAVPRGVYEKSLTWYRGKYYMTIRNDLRGYVTVSDDGLNFAPLRAWTFDDGSDLGSYNTQQKWVTHGDGLFLVYTRRGANNDHIPRHRAPLFIAEVDPEKLHVLRRTERVAVPERGADIGNFDATTVNARETWITTAGGPAFLARIQWSKPNSLAGRVN
ncbi:MAG: exo-alpha-sialidase [Opitutaceae bacterium]|nr:exo-alpha-sialidase [Opitutaceae bacterium]